ncbi:hypothetical protein QBC40DRAFT_287988 [Triangularia verruculosa]|uniref:Uncharacterized protein n=1 Tax=Triangularia verruculosa TaxID=2587418 RepID=A0AAN7AR32_9PEZI|nr:hypothetical protein QBC40DRAFT_287988 [Triangularia verruculosa]
MSVDLRRALARHELQKKQDELNALEKKRQEDYDLQQLHQERQAGGYGSAPGAWQAAALWNLTAPKPRYPIIIGPESIFKSADQFGAYFEISEVPTVAETRTVDLDDLDGQPPSPGKTADPDSSEKPYVICDVDMSQSLDLEDCTIGDHILVWFHDKPRNAWLPRAWKEGNGQDGPTKLKTTASLTAEDKN